MYPFRPFYDMVAPFVPLQYSILAQQWGLYSYWGPIVAFIAAVLLLFGLFYLGSLIAFGRLIGESESAKKALILISATMGIIGAWYGAGMMLSIMSNLIYLAGIFIGGILLASIGRAMLGGWHAAGATVEEARKQEVLAYASMIRELKRMGYTDEQIERILKEKGLWNQMVKVVKGGVSGARELIKKVPRPKGKKGEGIITYYVPPNISNVNYNIKYEHNIPTRKQNKNLTFNEIVDIYLKKGEKGTKEILKKYGYSEEEAEQIIKEVKKYLSKLI